ncbi:hypothetical protein BY996DRAFT_6846665 [Phakopsora pachyrhizi]|uniref:Expressed protein n=1 Tax=Phakopsora pachyrhizi TaxID=170000 RepID=A0AAV0BR06_PHAPC|nr:hypothetical protein BY996DRAFT_8294968 [Phakopsora pachyrhizi]KAI8458490.1 hypothetical protein BY996DRAFT_6846665 [Phakopsora pachyrhizi]CAH7688767.1 expressed protein [Phakopsora pachyrhizi]
MTLNSHALSSSAKFVSNYDTTVHLPPVISASSSRPSRDEDVFTFPILDAIKFKLDEEIDYEALMKLFEIRSLPTAKMTRPPMFGSLKSSELKAVCKDLESPGSEMYKHVFEQITDAGIPIRGPHAVWNYSCTKQKEGVEYFERLHKSFCEEDFVVIESERKIGFICDELEEGEIASDEEQAEESQAGPESFHETSKKEPSTYTTARDILTETLLNIQRDDSNSESGTSLGNRLLNSSNSSTNSSSSALSSGKSSGGRSASLLKASPEILPENKQNLERNVTNRRPIVPLKKIAHGIKRVQPILSLKPWSDPILKIHSGKHYKPNVQIQESNQSHYQQLTQDKFSTRWNHQTMRLFPLSSESTRVGKRRRKKSELGYEFFAKPPSKRAFYSSDLESDSGKF